MARAKAKRQVVEADCVVCGRRCVGHAARGDDSGVLCCGSLACDALHRWTEADWQCRAFMAARRPPWVKGKRLAMRTPGFCACTGEAQPLGVWVIEVAEGGRASLASACPACTVVRDVWTDDPWVRGAGDPSRWLDFEALRRHPNPASYWPEPERIEAAYDRPRAGDLALYRGELVPIQAVELPDGRVEVLLEDGTASMRPAVPVEPPAPPALVAAPPAPAVAPVRAVRSGPPLCLLVDRSSEGWLSRCGRLVATKKGKVESVPDAGMTGWGSQVSCPSCLAATAVRAAA